MVIETGDTTFEARKERFDYVMRRRAEKPRPTLAVIGEELGITRQNVWRIIHRGEVKPSGRPRSNVARRKRLVERLAKWQDRRLTKIAANKPTTVEDSWIAKVEGMLKDLS